MTLHAANPGYLAIQLKKEKVDALIPACINLN